MSRRESPSQPHGPQVHELQDKHPLPGAIGYWKIKQTVRKAEKWSRLGGDELWDPAFPCLPRPAGKPWRRIYPSHPHPFPIHRDSLYLVNDAHTPDHDGVPWILCNSNRFVKGTKSRHHERLRVPGRGPRTAKTSRWPRQRTPRRRRHPASTSPRRETGRDIYSGI